MASSQQLRERTVGLLMVGVLLGSFALVGAFYTQAFTSWVTVTVRAERAGLLMNPGNRVTLRGFKVGEILRVKRAGDGAVLTVGLNPDQVEWVPANVTARIVPNTIFGTKYLSLQLPGGPSQQQISAGDVVTNRRVTVEVNTAFENLASVLESVDVAKLNATLGALAQALDGQGNEIARLASRVDGYLTKLSGDLPALRRDLRLTSDVADLVSEVSPKVFRILRNATFTSGTLTSEAAALDAVLADVSVLGTRARQVLDRNGKELSTLLGVLRPTTGLLGEYSSGLRCFVGGLSVADELLRDAIGGSNPGINLDIALALSEGAYYYPEDLPKVSADNGPGCHGLPRLSPEERPAPYIETDTGTDPFPHDDNQLRPGAPAVAPLLFGPLDNVASGGSR